MRAAGLGGLLVVLQAATCSGLRALHEPAIKKVKLGGSHLMQRAVSATALALRDAEAAIAQDQTDVRQTILYIDKVKDSFGKEDSLWNGKMDQADSKFAQRLLSLFSNGEFVKVLDKAFKDLELVVKHIPALSVKRVQEVLKRKRDTADERFITATQFFKKETTLLGAQLNRSSDILNSVLLALPKDFDVYRRLGSVMVQELAQGAANITAHFSGSEEIFCDHVNPEIEARALPLLEYSKSLLPRVESFTSVQAPEVLPQVSKAVAKLSALTDSLHKLFQHDVHSVVDQVCAAIRVAGAQPTTSAPPAAEQPAEQEQVAAPAPTEAVSAAPAPVEAASAVQALAEAASAVPAAAEASAAPAPVEASAAPALEEAASVAPVAAEAATAAPEPAEAASAAPAPAEASVAPALAEAAGSPDAAAAVGE